MLFSKKLRKAEIPTWGYIAIGLTFALLYAFLIDSCNAARKAKQTKAVSGQQSNQIHNHR